MIREIRSSKLAKKVNDFLKRPACQSFMAKGAVLLVLWVICLIPVWIFIIVWILASPEGFWQITVIVSLGIFLGGGCQVILGIVGIVFTFEIIEVDY